MKAGLAFVEFSSGTKALSLCLCRSHTHMCSTRAAQEGSNVDLTYQQQPYRRSLHLDLTADPLSVFPNVWLQEFHFTVHRCLFTDDSQTGSCGRSQ